MEETSIGVCLRQNTTWQAEEAVCEAMSVPHCIAHALLLSLLLVQSLTMTSTEVLVTPAQCCLPYHLRLGLLVGQFGVPDKRNCIVRMNVCAWK